MTRRTRTRRIAKPPQLLVVWLAILVELGTIGGASGIPAVTVSDEGNLSVIVNVDDRAQVHPGLLDQAEKEATRIYRHSGIHVIWRTASATAGNVAIETPAPIPVTFVVELIVQARFLGKPPRRSQFLMGAAPPTARVCAGTAYLFLDRVTGFSNVQRLDASLVFGTVAAHEIGHVLLGRGGHSAEGLMRVWDSTDWQRAASGLLLFAAPEASAIRSAISNCRH